MVAEVVCRHFLHVCVCVCVCVCVSFLVIALRCVDVTRKQEVSEIC